MRRGIVAAIAVGFFCCCVSGVAQGATFYIAGNGSDSNSGTTKTTPWLHAPGMPKCTGACASHTPVPGDRFIFRGGDTWHFGNSSASPYTGGTWDLTNWAGNAATCVYEGTQTGCIYWGVDQTWFAGSAWSRPILNGDNPVSTTTVSSCAFQIGSNNQMVIQGGGSGYYNIFDNFEMLGLCTQRTEGGSSNSDVYIQDGGSGVTASGMLFQTNIYIHGWTATASAGTGNNALACNGIGGGNQSLHSIDHLVIDGSDSNPRVCAWGIFPSFYHFKDSIIRYTTQGVGQWCHDIHDNIFEHFYNPSLPTHGNILECNDDSQGNAPNQPANTPNVFYNNIVRHDDPSFGAGGQVHLWFCPETVPEYWFNNVLYDIANENYWDVAGPPTYACSNTGGQFMFNNTLVDGNQPCNLGPNSTGGRYLTVQNENLINTPYDSSGTGCTGGSLSATNIAMSKASAIAQGYLLSSGGITNSDTCASEGTKPCAPTVASNSTVGLGTNHMAYCTTLASYSSEYAIGTEAANACKYGTTDGCTYNTSTHSMICPSQTAVARPASTAWDVGAYQFSGASSPVPPTSLQAVVH